MGRDLKAGTPSPTPSLAPGRAGRPFPKGCLFWTYTSKYEEETPLHRTVDMLPGGEIPDEAGLP